MSQTLSIFKHFRRSLSSKSLRVSGYGNMISHFTLFTAQAYSLMGFVIRFLQVLSCAELVALMIFEYYL